MFGCRILTWEQVKEGYELINESLPDDAEGDLTDRTVSIVWTGQHYNLIQLL